MTESLPPIMRQPGLRLVGIGTTDDGRSYMRFETTRRKVNTTVVIITDNPTHLVYAYTVYDKGTRTLVTHAGPYGDPTKDEPSDDGLFGVSLA